MSSRRWDGDHEVLGGPHEGRGAVGQGRLGSG